MGKYTQPHTKAWSAKIDSFDAYVFVTPEYNHSMSGALKKRLKIDVVSEKNPETAERRYHVAAIKS